MKTKKQEGGIWLTGKEKAAVEYLPAPTGQNQPLDTEPTNIVTQATATFNGEISKNDGEAYG